METENLNKENVIVLDSLLQVCVNEGRVTKENLPKILAYAEDSIDELLADYSTIKLNYYRSYLKMIQNSGKAAVITMMDDIQMDPIEGITKGFIDEGGFTAVYKNIQAEAEHQERLREKTKYDTRVSKWMAKTYWWTFGAAIAGFILSVIALLFS